MRERPILFSGPMVRAILDGRKTQTRRVIALPDFGLSTTRGYDWHFRDKQLRWHDVSQAQLLERCPYGKPDDHLWVRETWWTYPGRITERLLREGADTWPFIDGLPVAYDADGDQDQWVNLGWVKKPSIHLPRVASRIILEVTNVRVERVQEISETDADREGCHVDDGFITPAQEFPSSRASFHALWDSINAKRGYGWDKNSWVWVVEFKKLAPA